MSDSESANPKVALITGGSRGIGYGIAFEFACEGIDLVINGTRDEAEVADVLSSLRACGSEVIYCQANIADPSARDALLARAREKFGQLDVLVNNAGVAPKVRKDVLDLDVDEYDRVMEVNLKAGFFLTQAAARWMVEQREAEATFAGCIINISSVSAVAASINRAEYCIAKAGVSMATRVWAVRLAEHGIKVYEIQPGIIETDMTAGVRDKYNAMIDQGLLVEKRWGTPEDIGLAAAALVRGDIPYAPGAVLRLDGGMLLPRL